MGGGRRDDRTSQRTSPSCRSYCQRRRLKARQVLAMRFCDRHHGTLTILGQNEGMEHRGIRYAVRIGIASQQWRVAICPPGGLPKERTVLGTFEYTQITARSLINSWLKQRSPLKKAK